MPKQLAQLMKHFGLTQKAAADLVGMRHTIVSRWLSGETEMPQSTAMAFQAALGVRWQWLLNGEGQMLLDDMGKPSAEEVRLVTMYRQSDMEARNDIIEQAEFHLGRSKRRAEK